MKKNRMMRIASCLLVLVLLTTCVISGTFAKYTTSANTQDSATVAKWGITLSVTGDDVLYDDSKTGNEVTAKAVTENNLAAPGTYQKLATVSLTGTPEVAYKITVKVNLDLGNWEFTKKVNDLDVTEEYCPLVFTVDGTKYYIGATGITTVDELEEAIEDAIAKQILGVEVEDTTDGTYEKTYNAGTEVAESVKDGVLVDWTWSFETPAEGQPLATYQKDAKDTILGNADTKATIAFGLTVTVDQVD